MKGRGVKPTKVCTLVLRMPMALPLCAAAQAAFSAETTIWFDTPATNLTESTPLGNGRLGAMMFGGPDEERIVLNESSVWSGSRQDADRAEAYKVLPEIQKLLREGRNPEAEALVNANFTCKGPGCRRWSGRFVDDRPTGQRARWRWCPSSELPCRPVVQQWFWGLQFSWLGSEFLVFDRSILLKRRCVD
jgi:hypothetical protein